MNIEERMEAITMNLELASQEIFGCSRQVAELGRAVSDLKGLVSQDAENIRALARIAEIHEHRITRIEGEQQQ